MLSPRSSLLRLTSGSYGCGRRPSFWQSIYSTLSLASTLAATLGENGVIAVGLFLLCCFLVLATVVTHGLKSRPSGAEIIVALGVGAVYLLIFVRMSIPTERSHLIEYGVVAILIYEALLERNRNGRKPAYPAILAIAAASLVGVIDEIIQLILPSHVFDVRDIAFNVLAAVLAVSASAALSWARRRFGTAGRQ